MVSKLADRLCALEAETTSLREEVSILYWQFDRHCGNREATSGK